MTDKKLHQADKLRNEKNKSEDDKPKNGVPEDFADDVTVQDAHGANRECSTAAAAFTAAPLVPPSPGAGGAKQAAPPSIFQVSFSSYDRQSLWSLS